MNARRIVAAALAVAAAGCSPKSAPVAAAAPAAATASLVAKVLEAYGGAEAIRAAPNFSQIGTVTSLLHPGQVGKIGRLYARPDKLRVEITYPDGGGETRVLAAQVGWRNAEQVQGPKLDAMVLQAARLDSVGLLALAGMKVTERGTWPLDGKTLRVLVVPLRDGMELELGVDPDTGLILRTRTAAREADRPIEFITTYKDFRKVKGVLFAFHELNWANGQTTGETILQLVDLPPAQDASYFRP